MPISRLAATALLIGLVGCASDQTPDPKTPVAIDDVPHSAAWVPAADIELASIENESYYAFTASGDRDAYVYAEEHGRGMRPDLHLTWLISVDRYAPLGTRLTLGDDAAHGWLMETIGTDDSRAIPLDGAITIHSRGPEGVSVTLNVVARGPVPVAGETSRRIRALGRRIDMPRREPFTPRFNDLGTTSGLPYAPIERHEPMR